MSVGKWGKAIRGFFGRGLFPHQLSFVLGSALRRFVLSPGELADRLHLKESSRVLEVGPGPGYFSVEVARRLPQGRLELFDLQREMLEQARRRLERAGLHNVGFTQGDACNLPYGESSPSPSSRGTRTSCPCPPSVPWPSSKDSSSSRVTGGGRITRRTLGTSSRPELKLRAVQAVVQGASLYQVSRLEEYALSSAIPFEGVRERPLFFYAFGEQVRFARTGEMPNLPRCYRLFRVPSAPFGCSAWSFELQANFNRE